AFTGAVGTDSRQQEGYDWFLKAVSNGDKRGTIMLASMYAGNNQVLVNYNVKQNLKLAERLIIDNGLSDAIGAARILSHTYGDWPAKMAIKNNRDKEFYWNKSHQWRLRAIERNDRISIIQGDGKDGYIDDIETLLDAIIKVSTIPHPVDRPEQEKLYFVRAYDDNLYVVYDWNRELLTSKKQYGYDVDVNLHAKIDEAYTKIVNAKRVFNF
ncbi:MAG: hypothetical protein JJ858_19235, partial [Rhizobiaceae bacterium]|nr:hypothetical protein [Rhizobiaceae bacterium]